MQYFTKITVIFLISIVASFFLGRYSVSTKRDNPSNANLMETKSNDNNSSLEAEKDLLVNNQDKNDSNDKIEEETRIIEKEEVAQKPTEVVEEKEKDKTTVVANEEFARTKMGISDKKIGEVLSLISANLESKKLAYKSNLMQDCSGIYHQMKDSIQKRLPSLSALSGSFKYPSPNTVRSTRQIADWYFRNKNLLIVQDALKSCNSIHPGSVMFYGKSNKIFKNITIDMLTDRANNYTTNGAIMHMAVVTAVSTDAQGNVIDYTIMHGRNPRRFASRTGSKAVQSRNTKNLPPFGNWKQQLVAIANIVTID